MPVTFIMSADSVIFLYCCMMDTGNEYNSALTIGTLEDGYIKSVSLPRIHAGTNRAPQVRAATSIQAITVAILPIANMVGGAYNPFL